MRPVNLIPPDARRGDRAAMRSGGLSYVVIGGLAAALLAVIVLAFTSKQISDREAEVAQLQQKEQEATARAESLSAFADFRAVQEGRTATVASLAQSRFDWQRVLNELALVIPPDAWLVELTGTVSPAVTIENSAEIATRDSVSGPALEIVGCAPSQDAVAGFVADLEDIDGVTRVGVASSERAAEDPAAATDGGAAVSSGSDEQSGECRTRDFITRFEIVVAFDAVATPATATEVPSVPAPAAPTGDQGQLAGAQAQQDAAKASAAEDTAEAKDATGLLPGG